MYNAINMRKNRQGKSAITKAVILGVVLAMIFTTVAAAAELAFTSPVAGEAYGYFCELLQIPRGSGNEKAVSDYLAAFAKKNRLEVVQDEALNVLIRKPGSKGRENEPPVILQAHMDMVCEKGEGVIHDFLKDPIIPVVEGDWLRASGTTLGADDGSGVSLIMAVLAADYLSHPPIEAVFTTQEEIGMGGAAHFDASLLHGKRFINLDSEEEGIFTVSCASSNNIEIAVPIEYEPVPEGCVTYALAVKGLTGGHSGIDIDKGHANANILAARLINMLDYEAFFVASVNGGSARNAIPRECAAVLAFPESGLDRIQTTAALAAKAFRAEYPFDEGLTVTLEKTDPPQSVMSRASARKVIAGILLIPNGVQSMSADIEGLVQTSNNLGIVMTDGDRVTLTNYLRSSMVTEQDLAINKLILLADTLGAESSVVKSYPPWEYKESSSLRDTMSAVFEEAYGRAPAIAAIHAGLECALFAGKIPDGDFISIGMTIQGAHTPEERMSISSYDRTCGYLIKPLEAL